MRALNVLLAARQPPTLAQLEALGLRAACAALPGWGLLFCEREHCVHLLHKSLRDWLLDATRSGTFAVSAAPGHAAWAAHVSDVLRKWLAPEAGHAPTSPPSRGAYVYAHALRHLDDAGRSEEAAELLMQLPWLQATMRERGIFALIADVAARMHGRPALGALHRALRAASPGLQGLDGADALPGALVGRLGGPDAEAPVARLCVAACAWRGDRAWLRACAPTLQPPDEALELRLEGHSKCVTALLALADGRLASGSEDGTLRLWHPDSGECEHVLAAQGGSVLTLTELACGRLVSITSNLLQVWNTDRHGRVRPCFAQPRAYSAHAVAAGATC